MSDTKQRIGIMGGTFDSMYTSHLVRGLVSGIIDSCYMRILGIIGSAEGYYYKCSCHTIAQLRCCNSKEGCMGVVMANKVRHKTL